MTSGFVGLKVTIALSPCLRKLGFSSIDRAGLGVKLLLQLQEVVATVACWT